MEKQLIPDHQIPLPPNPWEEMFSQLKAFQIRIGNGLKVVVPGVVITTETLTHLNMMLTCVVQEACEARDWLPWKPWKRYIKTSIEHPEYWEFINELADIQIFTMNAAIAAGCDEKLFAKMILNKIKENNLRQDRGY